MPRPARFDEDQILDAALHLVAEGGPRAATIGAIGARVGAPVGSIYHRFGSRDLLLAKLWIRSIKRYQTAFLESVGDDRDVDAAIRSALSTLEWVRTHNDEATAMLLYRKNDLAAEWPKELGTELEELNTRTHRVIEEMARVCFGDEGAEAVERVGLAVIDLPYAAVRRYLARAVTPPQHLDAAVATACRSILLGDRSA